jgi:hypothetical protein
MSQKGGIAVILLILVLVAGLAIGGYFITQNTSFFSNAGSSAQITIPYASPTPVASPAKTPPPTTAYENPFDSTVTNDNPFDEAYENPFNTLK